MSHPDRTLAACSVACAALFLALQAGPVTWLSLATKSLSVSTLALVALRSTGPMSGGALAAPLLASSAGDFLLEWDRQRLFVAGLGAFLLAHLLYIALFRRAWPARRAAVDRRSQVPAALPWPRIGASIAIVAAGLALTAWLWPGLGDLRIPVASYIAVLLAMAVAAQLAQLDTPLVAVGAVLFVASDSMIGIETFRTTFAGSGPAIWVSYYLAQCAITLGCLRAGRTAR